MGPKPPHGPTFDEALAQFFSAPFDAALVPLARAGDFLPVYAVSNDLFIIRPDQTADIVSRAPPHDSTVSQWLENESRHRLEAIVRACAAHRHHLQSPTLERPTTARTCWVCEGTGRTDSRSDYHYELSETTLLCGPCAGRGWQRDLLAETEHNPLQQVFGKCWTRAGFSGALATNPRTVLREEGVVLAEDVPVSVEIERDRDLCWTCQLSFARIEASGDLLDDPADFTANIRVTIREGSAPFLTMVVGHHRHICTCAEPDLYPFVVNS